MEKAEKKLECICLNDDQKKLVEDNMNLVQLVIARNWPGSILDEDLIQEGYVGLCLAAYQYVPSDKPFFPYAWSVISNMIKSEFRRRYKEDIEVKKVSLSEQVGTNTKLTMLDTIPSNDEPYVDVDYFYGKLSKEEKFIISELQDGKTPDEIAVELERSVSSINCKIRKMKRILGESHE